MGAQRRSGAVLLLTLVLGGWSPVSPRDPEIAEHWYPLACRVWAGQLHERVGDLRATGRIDPSDAFQFEAAIRRGSGTCATRGFDTLRLLISLGDALTDWQATAKGM